MSQALPSDPRNLPGARVRGGKGLSGLPPRQSSSPQITNKVTNGEDEDEVYAKQLIAKIKKGNQEAFGELVQRYNRQVAALAYKMVNNYDEAADVAQIVFVKMYDNVWRFDASKKFYSWLYRITVNASIDYMRKHKRHRHEPLEDFHETTDNSTSDPESHYRRSQISWFVEQAANSLSEKQRSVFVLRDIEGCDIDEVANCMNVSEATVRWYLHRARIKIRKELRRQCPQVLNFLGLY
ncbi:MAG: sigma-70 family RNA polymerase sigma factor [Candidatus Zixiibacteriota bacterium]|nr:MAG: sigma-70 family RNA polymerase sigma factor [candidate division Zixibacteria bacterium]